MERWIRGALAGTILMSSAVAAQAVPLVPMTRAMHIGTCPRKDAAVVILSKDPYCATRHLSGDACEARWKAYWFETAQLNGFLEQCRMQHWPEHKT
jgi:hypothetical protein